MLDEEPFSRRLIHWTKERAHHPMILSPGDAALDGSALFEFIGSTRDSLAGGGFRTGHRIISCVGHGADAAAATLAIASYCSYVSLNPEQSPDEWVAAFRAIEPAALLIREGDHHLPAAIARERGVPLITLASCRLRLVEGRPQAEENALPGERFLIQTSGTVRPKYVPRTGAGICAAVDQIRGAIAFSPEDRCAVAVPSFHALGLLSCVLLPALTGGSAIHPRKEDPPGFFDVCENDAVSWFAASPAALLELTQFARRQKIRLTRPLRFIRTAGAILRPELAAAAKEVFGARVLSTYGSTEAPFISTVRPEDPEGVDHAGRPCPGVSIRIDAAETGSGPGEVVVSSDGLATSYWNDPHSTRDAFESDATGRIWYKTGDIGSIDHEGNLRVLGRRTDIINRGGLKVGPWEVEAALLQHQAVAEAVAFKIPDKDLGEEVAAAVTLHAGGKTTAAELRGFAGRNLSLSKTPRRVFVLNQIPRNEMGKPLRGKLAETFAQQRMERPAKLSPRNEFEAALLRICEEILGVRNIGMNDNFFDLGGDSLSAVEYLYKLSTEYGLDRLDPSVLFEADSFSFLADLLREARGTTTLGGPFGVVALRPALDKERVPLVVIGHGTYMLWKSLVRYLPPDQPVYLLMPPRISGRAGASDFRDIAGVLVTALQEMLPSGPYALAGTCLMGALAQEMAAQLEHRRERVAVVFALQCWFPFADRGIRFRNYFHPARVRAVWREEGDILGFLRRGAQSSGRRLNLGIHQLGLTRPVGRSQLDADILAAQAACRTHQVTPISARLVTIWSDNVEAITGQTPEALWGRAAKHEHFVERLPCNRITLLSGLMNSQLAGIVDRHLRAAG